MTIAGLALGVSSLGSSARPTSASSPDPRPLDALSTVEAGAPARTPSQLARRERIVEAATRLLEEREYERIQIREVAA